MSTPFVCIDGSYLHGPIRAAVEVAVKPPDESFRRLETASLNGPNPQRGMSDGCSKQVASLGLVSHINMALYPLGQEL